MGNSKASCSAGSVLNHSHSDDVYGPWLRSEPDTYTVVKEPYSLRRVEIPRGDIFDTFSRVINTDARNGEDELAVETIESPRDENALTQDRTQGGELSSDHPMVEGHSKTACLPTKECHAN